MSANNNPIFAGVANNGAFDVVLTTGNNNYDGTNAAVTLVYTAGANGSFAQKLTCKAIGSNVATVIRLFVNNGSTNGTAANNIFFTEFTLAITTASAVAVTQTYEFALNKILAPNTKIYAVLATTVAAGYAISIDGGDY